MWKTTRQIVDVKEETKRPKSIHISFRYQWEWDYAQMQFRDENPDLHAIYIVNNKNEREEKNISKFLGNWK